MLQNFDWKKVLLQAMKWLLMLLCKSLAFLLFITLTLIENMCKGINGLLYQYLFNKQLPSKNEER